MKFKVTLLWMMVFFSATTYGQTKKKPIKKGPVKINVPAPPKLPRVEVIEGSTNTNYSPPPPPMVVALKEVRLYLADGTVITARSVSELDNLDFETIKKFSADNNYTPAFEEVEFTTFLNKLLNESPNLEELNLRSCKLKTFPQIKNVNNNLSILDLSNNELSRLPEGIEKFVNLKKQIADKNMLSTLPQSIAKLTKLTWLSLTNNPFTQFPEEIFKIPSLEVIDIYRNQINTVPDRFNLLPNLTNFSMQYTKIESLPASFANLAKLTDVSLNGNQFKEFPASVAAIKTLKNVDFSGNPVDKALFMQSLDAIKWRGLFGLYNLKLSAEDYKAIEAKLKLIDIYH